MNIKNTLSRFNLVFLKKSFYSKNIKDSKKSKALQAKSSFHLNLLLSKTKLVGKVLKLNHSFFKRRVLKKRYKKGFSLEKQSVNFQTRRLRRSLRKIRKSKSPRFWTIISSEGTLSLMKKKKMKVKKRKINKVLKNVFSSFKFSSFSPRLLYFLRYKSLLINHILRSPKRYSKFLSKIASKNAKSKFDGFSHRISVYDRLSKAGNIRSTYKTFFRKKDKTIRTVLKKRMRLLRKKIRRSGYKSKKINKKRKKLFKYHFFIYRKMCRRKVVPDKFFSIQHQTFRYRRRGLQNLRVLFKTKKRLRNQLGKLSSKKIRQFSKSTYTWKILKSKLQTFLLTKGVLTKKELKNFYSTIKLKSKKISSRRTSSSFFFLKKLPVYYKFLKKHKFLRGIKNPKRTSFGVRSSLSKYSNLKYIYALVTKGGPLKKINKWLKTKRLHKSHKINLEKAQKQTKLTIKTILLGRNSVISSILNLSTKDLFIKRLTSKLSHKSADFYSRKKQLLLKPKKRLKSKKVVRMRRSKSYILKSFFGRLSSPNFSSKKPFLNLLKSKSLVKKGNQLRSLSKRDQSDVYLKFYWKVKSALIHHQSISPDSLTSFVLPRWNYVIQAIDSPINTNFFHLNSKYFASNNNLVNLWNPLNQEPFTRQTPVDSVFKFTLENKALLNSITDHNLYQTLHINSFSANTILPHIPTTSFKMVNTLPSLGTPTYFSAHTAMSTFLNDLYAVKSASRINILTRTGYFATEPGVIIPTNTLRRNQLNTRTYLFKKKTPMYNASNLLFVQKSIPNYKRLFMMVSGKSSNNFVHTTRSTYTEQNSSNIFDIDNTFPFNNNKTVKGTKKSKFKSHRKINKRRTKFIKPTKDVKISRLRKLSYKYRFRKVSGGLLSFNFRFKTLKSAKSKKFKKKFKKRKTLYVRRSRTVSNKLVTGESIRKSIRFYYNYTSIFMRQFFWRKKKSSQNVLKKSFKSTLILRKRIKLKKFKGRKKFKKKKKITLKKSNKIILNIRRSNKLTKGAKRIKSLKKKLLRTKIVKKKPLKVITNNLNKLVKNLKNKSMPRSKHFFKKSMALSRKNLLSKKSILHELVNIFSYKKFIYKISKYSKSRIIPYLLSNVYPLHRTTKRFKVDNHLTKWSSPNPTPVTYFTENTAVAAPQPFSFKKFNSHALFNSDSFIVTFLESPFVMKSTQEKENSVEKKWDYLMGNLVSDHNKNLFLSNLIPSQSFKYRLVRKIYNSTRLQAIQENLAPWYYNTLIRFMEHVSGKKCLFQFYPFVNNDISYEFFARYKKWLPRMSYYERRLGHKFFLEEAIHIMHLSFLLKDPKLICSWLKAIILRISFWKTRSIFRFLKYLIHHYFRHVFANVGLKGLKIKLKGKISAAGNSRKRTILYRTGKTSHSQISLRVVNEFMTISTFTGVMGFQIWLFY